MKYGKTTEINAKSNRERVEESSKNMLTFGISFLDDCFFGIKKNDLITIGADSGFGKTELSTHIACNNAKKGKKVYYFALEAYEREIETRISYKIAANNYYNDNDRVPFDVCFPMYENNTIDKRFLKYAIPAEEQTERVFGENLKIVGRGIEGYNVNHFVEDFKELNLLADLIIIDHINYFDQIGSMTEQQNLSYAAKKINEMVNLHNVPVIIITHLNRSFKASDMIVPDQHAIHGSSNVAKESTKVAFICREKTKEVSDYLSPTIIYPAKFRGMGNINNYVGCIDYDIRTNKYSERYVVGELDYGRTKIKQYLQRENKPFWAKRGQ